MHGQHIINHKHIDANFKIKSCIYIYILCKDIMLHVKSECKMYLQFHKLTDCSIINLPLDQISTYNWYKIYKL